MTREESTNRIYELNEHYGINLGEIEVGIVAVEALINEIYNDFESRTCENCKHFIDEKGTNLQFCNAVTKGGIIGWNGYGKDFGCNKFERKKDE